MDQDCNRDTANTGQCKSCFDLHGDAALPEHVKAKSQRCCICNLLAQICSVHKASGGGDAYLLQFYPHHLHHGLKLVVLGTQGSTDYRLMSASRGTYRHSRLSFVQQVASLPYSDTFYSDPSPALQAAHQTGRQPSPHRQRDCQPPVVLALLVRYKPHPLQRHPADT